MVGTQMEATLEEKMKRTREIWGKDLIVTLSISDEGASFVACHAQPPPEPEDDEEEVTFSDPGFEKLRRRGKIQTLNYFG